MRRRRATGALPRTGSTPRATRGARGLLIDAGDGGAMRGDVAIRDTIWARAGHAAASSEADAVDSQLSALHAAAEDENGDEAAGIAAELIGSLERMAHPE